MHSGERTKWRVGQAMAALGMTAVAAGALACGPRAWAADPAAPASEAASTAAPAAADTAKAATDKTSDPFQIPTGTPEELMKYMEGLTQLEPPSRDPKDLEAFQRKLLQTVRSVSEQILGTKPEGDLFRKATAFRVRALGELKQLGDADAGEKLLAMPKELRDGGQEELANAVQAFVFRIRLDEALEAPDAEQAVTTLKPLTEEIAQFAADHISQQTVELAMSATQLLDSIGAPGDAAKPYRTLAAGFKKSEIPALATLAVRLEGAARRSELVGQEMPLSGKFLDGGEFSWDQYKDQVVLVQFWATWCAPCREELVSIRQVYDQYHDQGFNVVGINLDDKRSDVEDFLKENPLPWRQIVSDNPKEVGFDAPMAVEYGVTAIPQVILVGKDHKVVSLSVRGEELGEEVAKLLGAPKPKRMQLTPRMELKPQGAATDAK